MPPVKQTHGAKPKNVGKTVLRILSYMKPFRLRLVLVAVCVVLSAGAGVAGSYFLKPLINDLVKTHDMAAFAKTLGVLGIVYVFGAVSSFTYQRIMLAVSTRTLYRIRTELFDAMERLPIRFFDTHTHGELMSRFTNDTDTMRELLSQFVTQFFTSVITVFGTFTMMLILSWQLTIMVVFMLFVILFIIKKVGGKSAMYFKKQQAALGKINGYIEERIDGQKVVKVFCHEEETIEEFDRLNEELFKAASSANTFANILMPIMNNLGHVQYSLTAMLGGLLAILGILDIGTIAAFMTYTRSFSQPISQMSQLLNTLLNALAGAERIFDLIDVPPETDNGYVTLVNAAYDKDGNLKETTERTGMWAWKHPHHDGTLTYTKVEGKVEFLNVVFGYEENKTVLNGISLYAKPGQKIAFVGSTGAGKTTITNLINRFYDVPDGKIRYDGININKIKKADLRRSLSMVLQDTHLFTGTVLDNIRYGRLDATDEECMAAARLANAESFIRHLPEGYHTHLSGDGANLSQGQRQLLAIARAAVADPPVLILDEATSSIDTRTEALIEKGMDQLMEDRTVFVIAHRLSTVRNSHAIMVLEHGKIIERGDHESLIAQKGKYYELYTGAFELS